MENLLSAFTSCRPPTSRCVLCRKESLNRSGVTVVELLAVMAVLTVTAALLLPAVQSVRESARTAQCTNNLREIGIDFQKTLCPPSNDTRGFLRTRPNVQCPADVTGSNSLKLPKPIGRYRRASHDYMPTRALRVEPTSDDSHRVIRGAWWGDFSTRKITDGMSKTFAFVEMSGRPWLYQARRVDHAEGPMSNRQIAGINDFPRHFRHHELADQHPEFSGMEVNRTNSGGIYAFHDGANTLFCDGSVRLLAETTDPAIAVAFFSRAEGDLAF